MKLKAFSTWMLAIALAGGVSLAAQTTTTTSTGQSAKQDMKDAGHDTKTAATKTGSAVKKTTKKTVHKGAHATKKGANKVEDKTSSNPQ
jgi:hypothetical protein